MVRDSRCTTIRSLRFCIDCNIFRPPNRCSHCYDCQACVIGFDHHCVWLGTCIAIRNYADFIVFLVFLVSFICYIEYSLFVEITQINSIEDVILSASLRERLHVSILVPFCFLFFIMVGCLFLFHMFLICKHVTTHEYLKDQYSFGEDNTNVAITRKNSTINPFRVESMHKNIFLRVKLIWKRMVKSRNFPSMLY